MQWLPALSVLLVGISYGKSPLVHAGGPGPRRVPAVDVGYVEYAGSNEMYDNTVAYLGIPYAEPPLGERRFRAPAPLNISRVQLEAKGKVVDATQYPLFCIQGTTGAGDSGGAGSEDCLKVNIYAPSRATKHSKLPVLVYIHGGGYIYGNPANWPFEHWVHQHPNVVIVSVYYRLSSLGFLAIPELRNSVHGDLNAGFLDQVEALRWVKNNIRHFGGDPGKVTINGESAGGSSVELHLVSNVRERLFSQAIAQSVYRAPLPTPEQRQPLFQVYSQAAGCGAGDAVQRLACLRAAPIDALARAQDTAIPERSGYRFFTPVIDGKTLPDYPTRLITEGNFAKVPLIVGATTNETLGAGAGTDAALTLRRFFPSITDANLAALEMVYPPEDFANSDLHFQALVGDSQLICARSIFGSEFARRGQEAYTYRYNQRNPTNGGTGVWHASENWMMFRGTNTGTNGTTTFTDMNPQELAFSEELIAYWLSFVRTGNPNTFKLSRSPRWPRYTAQSKARIVLQQFSGSMSGHGGESGSHTETESLKEGERCRVVASQVENQQN